MSGRTVISVRGLGKRYELGETFAANTARDALAAAARRLLGRRHTATPRRDSEFWALKDVSFDVAEGEVLGIIGSNGAGKSTLLKILSQITEPTTGEVRIRGRVASLLEVGTGFHPELSGRENVFMNGAILGMSQAEIRQKFAEIVDFSGVEAFIDTPVKRYSSGMLVRLAFSVAAHLEPEILVIDEVLAVGDTDFQQRCLGKMETVSRSGRTILFVSHSMAAVQSLCTRAIVLRSGLVALDGQISEAIAEYQATADRAEYDIDLREHAARVIKVEPSLSRLRILDDSGSAGVLTVGRSATFTVDVLPRRRLRNAAVALHFIAPLGQRVMTLHSGYQAQATGAIDSPSRFECCCPALQLAPGRYRIVVAIAAAGEQLDRIEPATSIEVAPADYYSTGKVPPQGDGVFWPTALWTASPVADQA